MRYPISFSSLAERKLFLLLNYLIEEWSVKAKNNFRKILDDKLEQISINPESCIKSSSFRNLHRCVLTRQTSLLYRIKNNHIEIITIFDNRSGFKSVQKEIRDYYGKI